MSLCIATSRLVHNDGYIQKLSQLFNSPEILWFERLCLVTKVLSNLNRFYSILTTIQSFKFRNSAIMDQFVTFRKRVYRLHQGELTDLLGLSEFQRIILSQEKVNVHKLEKVNGIFSHPGQLS